MTVLTNIDSARLIEVWLAQASPEPLTSFVNSLMSAEAVAVCDAV